MKQATELPEGFNGQEQRGGPGIDSSEEVHLRDYWRVIYKHRWLVITAFVVVFVTVAIITFHQTPIYKATTKIQIDTENPNVISIEEVVKLSPSDREYNETQYKLIQSRKLAMLVIAELHLDKSPEFMDLTEEVGAVSTEGFSIKKFFSSIFDAFGTRKQEMQEKEPAFSQDQEDEKTSRLINDFLKRLEVEGIRNTRLTNISFVGRYPKIVTRITNTIARLFIEHNLKLKVDASTEALTWLNQHVEQLKKKVEGSEEQLQKYKEENDIISLEGKQNIIVERLGSLNNSLVQAKNERLKLETLYNQITKNMENEEIIESLPSVINNDLIQSLKTQYISLQSEYTMQSKKLGKKHPHIIEIKSKMEVVQENLQSEIQKILNSIKTEYNIALSQEAFIRDALEAQKKEAMDLQQKAIQYGVLKREAESNQEMFNVVLSRFKETDLTRGLNISNIRIIDPAEVPREPFKPNRRLNLLLGTIVGLMGGIGFAFFIEYLDDTIKTPEDLKRYVGLTFLGPIPHHSSGSNGVKKNPELITLHDPKSQISEAYKGLRTSILFSFQKKGSKTLLITSAGPGEGKTMTLANLAITLAQADSRVLVIDCDMRKPRVHKIFNIPDVKGISNLLIGQNTVDEVVQDGVHPRLKIIPCGQRPPNPSEIISSPQMSALLEALKQDYDYILLDSPPLVAVTDSVILSRIVDGVCLVIKGGATSKEIIARGAELLKNANAHIIGATINDIDVSKKNYYYYYQYYYYSYYGDESKGERRKRKVKKPKSTSDTIGTQTM